MRESKITVAFVVAVVVLLCAYVFVFQVRVNEVAVHYRPPGNPYRVINQGDELTPQEDGPGLYFRLPPPFDRKRVYDKRVRVLDGPLAQTQLKDGWQVIMSIYCTWRIYDPVNFHASLESSEEMAQQKLKEVIFNEASRAVSDLNFHDLVSTEGQQVQANFDALEQAIARGVRASIEAKGYGLRVAEFGIRRIAIPESTTEEVFKRMRAERQKVAETYRAEGQSRRKTIIAEAEKDAQKLLADAESQAKSIRSEGEAAEAQYYDIFAQQPELAIFLRRLEALRTIARKARESDQPITFVLDPQTEPLSVLSRGAQGREELEEPPSPENRQEATDNSGSTDETGE